MVGHDRLTLNNHVDISRRSHRISIETRVGIVVVNVRATTTVTPNLIKVPCHSMLATILILSLSRQVVDHLASESDVSHRVQDCTVGNVVAYPHDLSV